MKKIFCLVGLFLMPVVAIASPTLTPSQVIGVDLSQPYILTIHGDSVMGRGNLNMGINYRYFTNDTLSFGLRYALDVEKQFGTARTMSVAPGIQVQWLQGQNWMPYFRGDLPFVLHGAPNATLDSDQMDLGVNVGTGLAWNIGNQIGLDHLLLRYDFTFGYFFGIASAWNQLSLEFFKIGMEYRF